MRLKLLRCSNGGVTRRTSRPSSRHCVVAPLDLAAQALAQYFNTDDSDHSDSTVACACGGKGRYAGRRPKTFTTLLGPLTLERAYYHCDACRTGVCPRDRALGMHATSLSPGVLRIVGLAASDFSFAAASDLLWELAAVRVETKQVERCAEALGREVADDERAVAETVPSPAPTMYLGMDGSGVPVRPAEVEARHALLPLGRQLQDPVLRRPARFRPFELFLAGGRLRPQRPVGLQLHPQRDQELERSDQKLRSAKRRLQRQRADPQVAQVVVELVLDPVPLFGDLVDDAFDDLALLLSQNEADPLAQVGRVGGPFRR